MTPAGRPGDAERVAALLGRPPRGDFEVVVRSTDGDPVVIRNAPLLSDGVPMPTRYWLMSRPVSLLVDRLEAGGGVRRAEAAVDPAELAAAHARYAHERDAAIPGDWTGPRPHGGVAGTRRGVKCLHAHLAWYLAGGDDPVGRWTAAALSLGGFDGDGPSPGGIPTGGEPHRYQPGSAATTPAASSAETSASG